MSRTDGHLSKPKVFISSSALPLQGSSQIDEGMPRTLEKKGMYFGISSCPSGHLRHRASMKGFMREGCRVVIQGIGGQAAILYRNLQCRYQCCCAKYGDREMAVEWLSKAQEANLMPGIITYNSFINACEKTVS